jgi:HlyD family secretion protein
MRTDSAGFVSSAIPLRNVLSGSVMGRFKLWHLGLLLGVISAVAVAGRLNKPAVLEVRVASPTYQNIESSVSTIGKVVPVGEFQARANFSGMVEKVYVQLGERVSPGQLLIKMKDPFASSRVAAANAALQSAKVSNENVELNGSQEDRINFAAERTRAESEQSAATKALSALKQLEQNGSASDSEVVAAEQRLRAANASLQALNERSKNRYSAKDVASWKAKVAETQASLDAEKVTFANANITSPISGTVYLLPVLQYDFVPMGADLLRVADLTKLEIRANFDEPDVGKLMVGQPVKIKWDGKPEQIWQGHIKHAPMAIVTSGPRSVGECTIEVDDSKGDLPANTNVDVTVTTKRSTHAMTIPREALHTEGSANYVYRVVGDRLVKTPVDVGVVNLAGLEITKGLTSNDVIALHALNNQELRDSLKIQEVR